MKFWWTTIRELRESVVAQGSQIADLYEELKEANQKTESERQLRIYAEAMAADRLAVIDREVQRSQSAERARDEVLRMVYPQVATMQAEKSTLDVSALKEMKVIRRQKRQDKWFGPDFMSAIEDISKGKRTAVPPPPAATEAAS